MLMDHFKGHIRKTYPEMMYFLTYADNYAVGYFRKQGFSKEITLDRAAWAGYIKDYEGGTIMQCKLLPKVDYLSWREIVVQQREVVLNKIREKSRSHIVYDGIPRFQNGAGEGVTLEAKDIPGLREFFRPMTFDDVFIRALRCRGEWVDAFDVCRVSICLVCTDCLTTVLTWSITALLAQQDEAGSTS